MSWRCRSTHSWCWHHMEMSGQVHALATFLQGNNPWFPLDRRLGVSQSWSGCRNRTEKNLSPCLDSNPWSSSAIPLRYPGYATCTHSTIRSFIWYSKFLQNIGNINYRVMGRRVRDSRMTSHWRGKLWVIWVNGKLVCVHCSLVQEGASTKILLHTGDGDF